jgi:hypothetical protein
MSNERRHPDDITDPIVSNAYRELSNERAPEHLDHLVLNEARNAAKQRHRSAMAWLRPAAWVTTIGLCLAIVLEVADLPLQEQDVFDEAARSEKAVVQEPVAEELPASAPAGAMSDDAAGTENFAAPERTMAEPVAPVRNEVGRADTDAEAPTMAPAEARQRQIAPDDLPAALEVDADADRRFLREAEDRARLQAGSDELQEEVVVTGVSSFGVASDVATEAYCTDDQRADPNEWLACILDLENRGMSEAAMLERERLQEAFPDFYVAPDLPGQIGQ